MNKTHNTPNEQKQISTQLGSHSRIAFQVWDEERGKWFKSESLNPMKNRDLPRATQKYIMERAPLGGWRSRLIEIPEEAPVFRNMEYLYNLLRNNTGLLLGVETANGDIVRIRELCAIHHQLPCYIPTLYKETTANADEHALEQYQKMITQSPPVSDDFPWYSDNFWNGFVGSDTELWLPDCRRWAKAGELEFPNCAGYENGFLTMEREHGYGGAELNEDGELRFDWFPVLYNLVTETPCEFLLRLGYRDTADITLTVRTGKRQ